MKIPLSPYDLSQAAWAELMSRQPTTQENAIKINQAFNQWARSAPADSGHMAHIADEIRAVRVETRERYTRGEIDMPAYQAHKELCDKLVLAHISWYKKRNPSFDELSFVGASGDGGAVF